MDIAHVAVAEWSRLLITIAVLIAVSKAHAWVQKRGA